MKTKREAIVVGYKGREEFPFRVSHNRTGSEGDSYEYAGIASFKTHYFAVKFARELAKFYDAKFEDWTV